MLGALIGDIAGSIYERRNIKSKDFDFFSDRCRPTDDSIMSLAVAQAILDCGEDRTDLSEKAVLRMQQLGLRYPWAGYGHNFRKWLTSPCPQPYGSFGNGAAMRVSPCGFAASSLDEALLLSDAVTRVSHDHPEGMKGARAVAAAVYLARTGSPIDDIRRHIADHYYTIDFTLDQIRPDYHFDVTCQGSVPQALQAFFESTGFEDAIRNAISIGGDSDTIAAITGGIAEAFYGIPDDIRSRALSFLDETQLRILNDFEQRYA